MKKALICKGWGGPNSAVAALFAGSEVEVVSPQANWRNQVEASEASVLIGYSTGAFLLLQNEALWERFDEIVLFAPFEDFKEEAARGGRIKAVQMKYLLKWLRTDPLAALGDFYKKAGLSLGVPTVLPYPIEDLIWGIERLLEGAAPSDALSRAKAYIGAEDSLLDAVLIKSRYPNVEIVQGASHDLGSLLKKSGWSL